MVTRSCSTPSERGQLRLARDWKMLADISDSCCFFPAEIATTTLRPDLVLWSSSLKQSVHHRTRRTLGGRS